MAAAKPHIPVIVGPTGIGKTALVGALADRWSLSVVSADSRQVYRGLDIGTAKPDRASTERAPHYGLDRVDPGELYSAGQFARDAVGWLDDIDRAGRRAVVVGGTGFYVRALVDGLFRQPPMPAGARQGFRRWAAERRGTLAGWAARLDPAFDGGGHQRAARTVEVALLTGRPLSWWQRQASSDGLVRPWYVRLTAPRAYLHRRIAGRVRDMLDRGWVAEVQAHLDAGVAPDAPGLDAVGYRQIVRHLRGETEGQALEESIVVATRRYAKRQETWFRHQLGGPEVGRVITTLDATAPASVLAERIARLWEGAE